MIGHSNSKPYKKLHNTTTRSFSEYCAGIARKRVQLHVIKVTSGVYLHPDLAI